MSDYKDKNYRGVSIIRSPGAPFLTTGAGPVDLKSLGEDGALTLETPLDKVYPQLWVMFAANRLFDGQEEGFYLVNFGSLDSGVVDKGNRWNPILFIH